MIARGSLLRPRGFGGGDQQRVAVSPGTAKCLPTARRNADETCRTLSQCRSGGKGNGWR